jgi:hypothetical protein
MRTICQTRIFTKKQQQQQQQQQQNVQLVPGGALIVSPYIPTKEKLSNDKIWTDRNCYQHLGSHNQIKTRRTILSKRIHDDHA